MPSGTPSSSFPASAAALLKLRTIVLLSREKLRLCILAVDVSGAGAMCTDSSLLAWRACLHKPTIVLVLAACMTSLFATLSQSLK